MELSLKKSENILVCNHPIALHNLTVMRDKNTTAELFRNATRRLAQILFLNATDNLPIINKIVETPLVETQADIIDPDSEVIVAPILRAGLVFSEIASELLPNARVHHIGLYRDEKTLKPVSYYNNLPESFNNPEDTFIYLLDPMLATGGSAIAAIKLFTDLNIKEENIRFICLISAPEGISRLHSKFPNVKIITACIDSNLNEFGYILPGLGDAGDRTFNTTY
ncbi:MAG: uracil phosphoribosyltransferase [Candidatus Melainabacteria bacterium GWF2_32_7]|nr:MAG: uracil phosphoribosyltransferase [Candidatus Melainabacteria bacterium GWF2_32_7]